MSYQLIGLDLDGTLTNSKKEIPSATRRALIDLMKKGKKVVLVSGRSTEGVYFLAKELEMDRYDGYIIGFNGGRIMSCASRELIEDLFLPEGVVEPIYRMALEYPGICLITYVDDKIIAGMKTNKYVDYESFGSRMKVIVSDHFLEDANRPLNKLVVCGAPEDVSELVTRMQDMFSDRLNIFTSDPYYGEIMPKGIDKGRTLKKLVDHLELSPENVICCGDSGNDIPMLEYAGLGVAMENALPQVKEVADYITRSNDEEGILHVIRKFMEENINGSSSD